jgi:hypothetical protein
MRSRLKLMPRFDRAAYQYVTQDEIKTVSVAIAAPFLAGQSAAPQTAGVSKVYRGS